MGLSIPVVWAEEQRLHEPGGEVWVGVHTLGTELPARADAIRAALADAGAAFVDAVPHSDAQALALHDPRMVDYLRGAWDAWVESGLLDDPGQNRVVPYLFPHPGLVAGIDPATPAAASARAGEFCFDTMTLIGPGTWRAARAALDAALTAADLVTGSASSAPRVAYACCRPPGHHAARAVFGGSCYLNNAAAAAARLRAALDGPVAVIDIDAHHGNGTQTIFYEDPSVLVGSVHVDPAAGWFPHYLGLARETGAGEGAGTNRNIPLAPGSGDEGWLAAVRELAAWALAGGALSGAASAAPTAAQSDAGAPRALVVALGVDAAEGDPESPLHVTAAGYREAGRTLGALGLPTVVVQEGGYDLGTLGELVAETLAGFEAGAAAST